MAGVVLLSVCAGLWVLRVPWYGDQALFAYGARAIGDGARLYVDFWDNKQPGVYWFFLAGGKLFGSYGLGPRLLEIAWLALAAVLSAITVRSAGGGGLAFALTPLATFATYYATARSNFLTQVESLVALPLVACICLAMSSDGIASRSRRSSMMAFGASAGVVALFKLVLLIIPLSLLVTALLLRRLTIKEAAAAMLWAACGGVVVAGVVLTLFVWQGSFDAAWWTSFVYPRQALESIEPAPIGRLLDSTIAFSRPMGLLLPLAAWGVVSSWTATATPSLRRLVILLVVWSLFALLAIGVQKLSWFRYHFALLLWPAGILAVLGIADLRTRLSAARGVVAHAVLVAAVACVVLTPVLHVTRAVMRTPLEPDNGPLRVESVPVSPGSQAQEAIRARPHAVGFEVSCGAVYVFGDPTVLLGANAPAALATNGWSWESYLPFQWTRLRADLHSANPAAVYLERGYRDLIEQRSPLLLQDLSQRYEVVWQGSEGAVWMVRRRSEVARPCTQPLPLWIPPR